MVSEVNLNIYKGDDYIADVNVFDADGTTPADLTGYVAQSQIRGSLNDDASVPPVVQFQCTIAGNIITIQLTHDQTKVLTSSYYYWDLQVIDSGGWITTLLAGQAIVQQEVTLLYSQNPPPLSAKISITLPVHNAPVLAE